MRCPTGDGLHETDDPKGGPCSGCEAWADEQARAFWQDQLEAMPAWAR